MSIKSRFLTNHAYFDIDNLKTALDVFSDKNKFIKTRFNLVLPNDLNSFVTKKSKDLRISKTEYILDLLEKQVRND